MRHIGLTVHIAAPAERVWALISTFRRWPEWGPTVRAVRSTSNAVGVGISGHVQTVAFLWLPFEITHVTPGREWAWKVAGVPATNHVVHEAPDGTCTLRFTVPVIFVPYLAVLWLGLRSVRRLAET